jgi:hypothetical protein
MWCILGCQEVGAFWGVASNLAKATRRELNAGSAVKLRVTGETSVTHTVVLEV